MSQQTILPGTARQDHPDIEAACLAADNADVEWSEAGKRREQKHAEVGAMLKMRNLPSYKYWVARLGRCKVALLEDQEPKLKFKDTDEGDGVVGQGVSSGDPTPAKPKGLKGLAASAKADSETNTEESGDGDVTVPDKATPKKARAGKAKTK